MLSNAALVVVLAVATSARAQEPDGEAAARASSDQGLVYYKLGKYEEAIASFKEAYRLSQMAGLLYNIAQAYRLDGHCAEALTYYERYLREEPDRAAHAQAEKRVPEMRACVAAQPPPVAEPAGPSRLPASPSDIAVQPPRFGAKRTTGLLFAGVGAAAVGLAIWYQRDAADASGAVDALYAEGGAWTTDYQDLERRGRRSETLAILAGAAGAAAIGTGGVLYWLGWRETRVLVAPSPRSATLQAVLSW